MKTIAAETGVSISTVSRAFSKPELLHPETLETVLAAAGNHNYRPSRIASGLASGQLFSLAIVVPDIANPLFPEIIKGAEEAAKQKGYSVYLLDTNEDPDLEMEMVSSVRKEVDGMVLCSTRMGSKDAASVLAGTPTVCINGRVPGSSSVSVDVGLGTEQILEHLLALGHRRLCYLSGPKHSWSAARRERALRSRASSGEATVVDIGQFPPTFDGGRMAADVALSGTSTALLAHNDLQAVGVLSRLRERSVDVPDEMSVVGFDDILMVGMVSPALTTVSVPKRALGRTAAELLVRFLQVGPSQRHQQRTLRPELIIRESTGTPRLVPAREGG
ncbi:MAG: LacI family DNA-binding transcriptional regulator [Acidimicrobiales bacterium]